MDGPDDEDLDPVEVRTIALPADLAGQRLDKALAQAAPALSRARLQALIAQGRWRMGTGC
ncbi:MAG: hypothetical protein WDM92_05995 [Caulobacteraceae bacterium]